MLTIVAVSGAARFLQRFYLFDLFDVEDEADFCCGPIGRFQRDLRLLRNVFFFLLNLFQIVIEGLGGFLVA